MRSMAQQDCLLRHGVVSREAETDGVSFGGKHAPVAVEHDVQSHPEFGIGTRYSDFTTASRTAFQQPDVRVVNLNVAELDAFVMSVAAERPAISRLIPTIWFCNVSPNAANKPIPATATSAVMMMYSLMPWPRCRIGRRISLVIDMWDLHACDE